MKKFLSLVLALIMTMSLVTVAGAEDFTDADTLTYAEAVDVMTAAGVVGGYADGSFNPTATLTRGAAAKIICNMILGTTTAEALVANEAPYADVPANHTFAGYIAYLANEGIVSGYADGSFKPAAPLTGYAFWKMLLGALGYDAGIEGYTGTNWAVAVAKQGLKIKLNKGLDGTFVGTKNLTREEACLYAFNAVKALDVEYTTNSTIKIGDIVISNNSTATPVDANPYYVTLFEGDLTPIASPSETFGRPCHGWKWDGETIGIYADEADYVYVNEFDKDLYDELKKDGVIDDAETVYYNGNTADAAMDKLAELYVSGKAPVNGWTIELYNTDTDDTIDVVVVIEEYFAEIGKFTAANTKKKTDAKVVLTVYEQGLTGKAKDLTIVDDPKADDDVYDTLAAYEKGDYVAVTVKGGFDTVGAGTDASAYILAVADVEAVAGKVEKVSLGAKNYLTTVKMAGTTYELNNECINVPAKAGVEGTLYLDAQGIVIGWVADTDEVTDKAIAISDVFKTIEDGKLVTKVEGYLSSGEKTTLTVTDDVPTSAEFDVHTYADSNDDGIYELTDAHGTGSFVDGGTYHFTSKVEKTAKALFGAYFASDVKVIYVDGTAEEVIVKEGLQDLASGVDKFATVEVVDGEKYVTAIFVETAPSTSTTTADTLIYVAAKTGTISILVDDEDKTFNTYEAYINGELVEDFYSEQNVGAGFFKNEVNDKTGAYVLSSANDFSGDSEIGVVENAVVAKYAANTVKISSTYYGVGSAVVEDLSTNYDGIEDGCSVYMIYDAETNEALYVYVLDTAI